MKTIGITISAPEMRSINRSAILELIRTHSPISRTEISRRLDVSMPTVMRIVDDLSAENLVRPTGRTEATGGRTRSLIEFNGAGHVCIGIDLGGTKLYGAVADLNGKILYKLQISHRQTQAEESFEVLCTFIDGLLEYVQKERLPLLGIGLGVPGTVDPESGHVRLAPSLGWDSFPLRQRLSERYPYPTLIENDVNLAAIGELWIRPSHIKNLVLITIGTGIGSGIIINRMLYHGSHYQAGEIGYVLPDRAHLGKPFPGFGALEQLASGNGIAARARMLLQGTRSEEALDALTAEHVFDAARRGEDWGQAILSETVDYLAQTLAFISQLLDVDVIILGGGVAREADLLISPILDRLKGSIPTLPHIEASQLGYQAVVTGSIMQLMRVTENLYALHKYA